MYIKTSIGKLSDTQLRNLKKGKNVRIKRGTANTVFLTQEQFSLYERAICSFKSELLIFLAESYQLS